MFNNYNYKCILEAVRQTAKLYPDKIGIIDDTGSVSYGDFYKNICGIARFLKDSGIKKNDKVILKSLQSHELLAAWHAVQMIGAIAVPLEKNVKDERVKAIAAQTDATLFISNSESQYIKTLLFSQLEKLSGDSELCDLPKSEDYSTILFTTGTTGKSKGILLTHLSDVKTAENVVFAAEMKQGNVELIPMPINHAFSIKRYYANVLVGGTVVLMDGVIFVNKVFEAFDKYKVTSAALAPSALGILFKLSKDRIAEYADRLDYMQFGGAHFPEPDKERLCRLLPNTRLYDFYGCTEAGCACTMNFNTGDIKPFRLGKATKNSEIKFVDDFGKPVEADAEHPARLITSGDIVMSGYYGEPELTAATLIDGCVYSNDLGYTDSEGWIYVLGRFDDVIITGGSKVAPCEVEDCAMLCDGVLEAACVPMEDKLMGHVPKLFVVVDDKYDEGNLRAFLADRLESFQVPKVVAVIDEIPKTYNGKTLKRELMKM